MSDAQRADVTLAVSEACTNVVVHAYPDGAPGVLDVEAEVEDDLCVVVRDEGRGFAPRPDSPGAGLGVPLIAALAQRVELRRPRPPASTEMAMIFTLPRRRRA
jgi:anti-sigma regulatory factor (Ser/Thr protein kinase)